MKRLIYFIIGFFRDFIANQKLIIELSKKDFKAKYLGSYLGILWAFVQPTVTIIIFWFIFQVGFKSMPVENFPFILWFAAALIPWNFFADSLMNGTQSITENSYLVKKVVFRVSILPLIKIYSALYVHLFFIVFLIIMFLVYGYYPDWYYLQILYLLPATFVLCLGLTWLTSALVIFLKDIGHIIAMVLQFGFWLTPIFYTLSIVPEKAQFFFKLNPMYYIVEGYRGAFVYKVWFWERPDLTIYYWLVTFAVLLVGVLVFRRLRPHFADVL